MSAFSAPAFSKTVGSVALPTIPLTSWVSLIFLISFSFETNSENLEEWDSFNFYVLLDEIENEFNVKFDLDETLEIKKIGDFKKIFQKHGINE